MLNHLKSRIEWGFSDIFSRHICSTIAETIGVTNNAVSFGAEKCSENHIWSCWDDSRSIEQTISCFPTRLVWENTVEVVINYCTIFWTTNDQLIPSTKNQVVKATTFILSILSMTPEMVLGNQHVSKAGVSLRGWQVGELLAIGYCSRTIGYCFSYCFLEIFVQGTRLWWRGKSRGRRIPPVPPLPNRESPVQANQIKPITLGVKRSPSWTDPPVS